MLSKSILISLSLITIEQNENKNIFRGVGKTIVLRWVSMARYGQFRKLGWVFTLPGTAGSGVNGLRRSGATTHDFLGAQSKI